MDGVVLCVEGVVLCVDAVVLIVDAVVLCSVTVELTVEAGVLDTVLIARGVDVETGAGLVVLLDTDIILDTVDAEVDVLVGVVVGTLVGSVTIDDNCLNVTHFILNDKQGSKWHPLTKDHNPE